MFGRVTVLRVSQFFKKYLGDNALLGNTWAIFSNSQRGGKIFN